MTKRVAKIGYSTERREIQLTVPAGTKTEKLSAILATVARQNIIDRLPRGCQTCTSGDHFVIREDLAELIEVNLET
jgi:hypothetical protein